MSWTQTDRGTGVWVTIPTDWLSSISGLSAHASQMGLLSFARDVEPETAALIHGPNHAQEQFGEHLINNVEATKNVTRSRLLTPIKIQAKADLDTAVLTEEQSSNGGDLRNQMDDLHGIVTSLSEQVADSNQPVRSETEIHEIVRDEFAKLSEE